MFIDKRRYLSNVAITFETLRLLHATPMDWKKNCARLQKTNCLVNRQQQF